MIHNNNQLIYKNINETISDSFCDNPSCLFCKNAYNHFNCLSIERQVLFLIFYFCILLILLLIVFVLVYIIYKFTPACFKVTNKSIKCFKSTPIYKFLKYYLQKIIYFPFKMLKPDESTLLYDQELNTNTDDFLTYLKTKYDVPIDILNQESKIAVNNFLNKKGTNIFKVRESYKVNYPKGVLPHFLVISMFFCIVLTCNTGLTSNALVNICNNVNSTHETCNVQYTTSISIDHIMSTYCSTIKENDINIGTLRLSYLEAKTKLNYNLRYYTSSWSPVTQTNYRCPHASGSFCEPQYCLNSTRDAYGNLDNFYLNKTFGTTTCDFVPSDGGCFFPQNACLWSGYGILPNPNDIEAIYVYNNYSPVEVDLFLEINLPNLSVYQLITLSQAQITSLNEVDGFPGTILITLDSPPVYIPDSTVETVSYPSGFIKSAINNLAEFTNGKLGDIQSNSPSSFSDVNNYINIETTQNSVLQYKTISDHSVLYSFYKSGLLNQRNLQFNKLPFSSSNVDYSLVDSGSNHYTNFGGINANMTNPGPIIVTINSNFAMTRQITPCSFSIDILGVTGCCSCDTNAYFLVDIKYDTNQCHIDYFSEDVDLLTVSNIVDNRIYFKTNTCSQTVRIVAQSNGYSESLSIYISLDEPIVQSFSNGVTTFFEIESSYDPDTSFDLNIKNFNKGFFDKGSTAKIIIISLMSLCLFCIILLCLYKISTSIGTLFLKKTV